MDTLYDLLGALPHDDAEGLRSAFRKAVKGAHPDLRPGDPDAAIKFRQIVRANDILLDKDQRAVYDHLLVLAQQEKDPAAAHPIAARIHRIASGVLAFASVSVVTVGGYLLFMHMSVALVAPTGSLAAAHTVTSPYDLTTRLTASIAAVSPNDAPDPAAVSAFIAARTENTGPASVVNAMAMAPAEAEGASPPAPEAAADHVSLSHVHEIFANGDAGATAVEADQLTQLETKFTAPYVDRGLLFFRDKSDDRAFPELPLLKRGEKPGKTKSIAATNGKTQHADALPKAVPLPVPRTPPRNVTTQPAPRYVSPQPQWYAATASFQ
ncbi:J domain-containing protein [Bradyrhizobium erythrophlei]|uniref:DnaJ domain-containing protein n=1 Tax=Bradyrhizobium erythrophlei TaxID=1437360 RepID=A0A1M7UBD8_9BRAD|nr:J domain-containing protein [Bradyrhizobium erythrophlei]SHN80361.1 DnaJ domain-containing protein [Bradyrhizobium erythrophlei]